MPRVRSWNAKRSALDHFDHDTILYPGIRFVPTASELDEKADIAICCFLLPAGNCKRKFADAAADVDQAAECLRHSLPVPVCLWNVHLSVPRPIFADFGQIRVGNWRIVFAGEAFVYSNRMGDALGDQLRCGFFNFIIYVYHWDWM